MLLGQLQNCEAPTILAKFRGKLKLSSYRRCGEIAVVDHPHSLIGQKNNIIRQEYSPSVLLNTSNSVEFIDS